MCVRIVLFLGGLLAGSILYAQENPAVNYIQSVVVDYAEPNTVYAASRGQGLFKSDNAGASWRSICQEAKNGNFNVIVQDPLSPERLWAGGQQSGLLFSSNRGESWKVVALDDQTINDIAIDKTNPRRLFVLADRGVYSCQDVDRDAWVLCFDHDRYIRDSADLNWFQKVKFQGSYRIFGGYSRFKKIAISPLRPQTVIAAANWEGGFFRSDDGGKTWRHETLSGLFRRVDVIYFHPTDPDVFYLGTHHQGLFKTYNFGKSWTPLSDGLEPQIRSPYYGAYLISGFADDPTDPDTFYSGSDYSNWKTTDGGEHWQELDQSLTCEFVRGMAVDPQHPNIVYAGSNVGMYKTTDGGRHWTAINQGFHEVEVIDTIHVRFGDTDLEFALTKYSPFVFRRAPGESWTSAGWLLAEYGIHAVSNLYFDASGQELVLETDRGDYVSRDGGYRWTGETPALSYVPVKSERKSWKPDRLDTLHNYVLEVDLQGEVFFEDSWVDSLYRRPPYISLQIVEEGYPYNGTVPLWSQNLDDYLQATLEVPRSAVEKGKRYLLYAEVRDFQKNYRTACAGIEFDGTTRMTLSITLQDGFCLKKQP